MCWLTTHKIFYCFRQTSIFFNASRRIYGNSGRTMTQIWRKTHKKWFEWMCVLIGFGRILVCSIDCCVFPIRFVCLF